MSNNFLDRIGLLFRKDREFYSSLYRVLGFYPHDITLYKMALMHKSVMHRNAKGKLINNERLEFLGDAILDAIVGDIVYRHFPGKREGFLTNTRSKLVQQNTLNKLADEMGINQLILSSGHSISHNSYLGGNAFEALVGALYLDHGYDACMKFMQKRILAQMINIDKVAYREVNFKSKLIEWSQKNKVRLNFNILTQSKDKNGSPVFRYQVIMEGIKGGDAEGYTKKESQQKASKFTLDRLRTDTQFIDSVFTAKGNRTKMEEEPVENVPDTDQKTDFIISQKGSEDSKKHKSVFQEEVFVDESGKNSRHTPMYASDNEMAEKKSTEVEKKKEDSLDLSDIHIDSESSSKAKENIIAAAEDAAFDKAE